MKKGGKTRRVLKIGIKAGCIKEDGGLEKGSAEKGYKAHQVWSRKKGERRRFREWGERKGGLVNGGYGKKRSQIYGDDGHARAVGYRFSRGKMEHYDLTPQGGLVTVLGERGANTSGARKGPLRGKRHELKR